MSNISLIFCCCSHSNLNAPFFGLGRVKHTSYTIIHFISQEKYTKWKCCSHRVRPYSSELFSGLFAVDQVHCDRHVSISRLIFISFVQGKRVSFTLFGIPNIWRMIFDCAILCASIRIQIQNESNNNCTYVNTPHCITLSLSFSRRIQQQKHRFFFFT